VGDVENGLSDSDGKGKMAQLKLAATDAKTWRTEFWGAGRQKFLRWSRIFPAWM